MALYHSAKGSVDYEVVGNPTIVDGVASGFSNSDYLDLSSVLTITPTSQAELQVKFKTPASAPETSGTICALGGHTGSYAVGTYWNTTWRQYWFCSGVGDIYFYNGNYVFASWDTEYTIKAIYSSDGSTVATVYDSSGTILAQKTHTRTTDISISAIGKPWADVHTVQSVDLNNTYIKVNGQPWFGVCPVEVQKHRLKGPVGYEVVGSPSIVDGVVSGFSKNDYIKTNIGFDISLSDSLDLLMKIKTPNAFSGEKCLLGFGPSSGDGSYSAGLFIASSYIYMNGGANGSLAYNFSESSIYYIRVQKNNSSITMAVSTDKINWTQNTRTVSSSFGNRNAYIFGRSNNQSAFNPFQGSIDLNETYIKVNGKLWFYQPADTKYIVKDGKLVWADPRLALSGPVGYEVVGNPTIVDGVASGFSGSNFINLAIPFNPGNNTWECVFKVTTGSDVSTESFIFRSAISAPTAAGRFGLNFKLHNRKFRMEVSYNGTAWDVSASGTHTVLANTIYWLKYKWDGSAYTMDYSLDGINFIRDISYESNTGMYNNLGISQIGIYSFQPSYSSPFLGSIDLKETYIKVNNQLWFYGKNYATQNIAPVPAGYTFGNTTTPSIGYVDMRTQQFTAAPSGATIGRDE